MADRSVTSVQAIQALEEMHAPPAVPTAPLAGDAAAGAGEEHGQGKCISNAAAAKLWALRRSTAEGAATGGGDADLPVWEKLRRHAFALTLAKEEADSVAGPPPLADRDVEGYELLWTARDKEKAADLVRANQDTVAGAKGWRGGRSPTVAAPPRAQRGPHRSPRTKPSTPSLPLSRPLSQPLQHALSPASSPKPPALPAHVSSGVLEEGLLLPIACGFMTGIGRRRLVV